MKSFIAPSYTFTPGGSGVGTVNLSGITDFNVKYLVAIINQTDGIVIYATGSAALGYTNVSGTTVTLAYDTSAMSGTDTLQVIYEDQNPLNVTLPDRMITGASTATLGDNALLASVGTSGLDVLGYRSATVQVVSTATSGNFTFEQSNDGTNWQILPVYIALTTAATALAATISATVSSLIYMMPINSRYIRLRISSGLGGGNITCYTRLTQASYAPGSQHVINNTSTNFQALVSANSLPLPNNAATETSLVTMSNKIPANLTVSSNRLSVDGSGVTQPISAASLPLPTGAATQTTLASVDTRAASIDNKLTNGDQRSKITDGTNNVAVKGASSAPTISDPSLVVTMSPNSPSLAVTMSGVATESTLSSIDGKLPALVGGKVPVDATLTAAEQKPNVVAYLKLDNTGTATYTVSSGYFAKVYFALAGYNGTKGYAEIESNRVCEIWTSNGDKQYDRAYFEGIAFDGEDVFMEMTDKDAFQLMTATIIEYPV